MGVFPGGGESICSGFLRPKRDTAMHGRNGISLASFRIEVSAWVGGVQPSVTTSSAPPTLVPLSHQPATSNQQPSATLTHLGSDILSHATAPLPTSAPLPLPIGESILPSRWRSGSSFLSLLLLQGCLIWWSVHLTMWDSSQFSLWVSLLLGGLSPRGFKGIDVRGVFF